ncbi:ComF family protein [Variovorax terrae]|uniref:ComF family protein n=1 Tax=Variovorax terrae TaxID=2923278 RepID=A0A9X2APJ4_9BURK|nr:phosphoribosyltransferase family protein [Variovorax terrae]MCJ0762111.1 ComF family protein [Variovorax terrae]
MFRELIARTCAPLPSQCAVCRAWPAQPVCEACVARFAQPLPRCRTCALAVPAGVHQCGQCLRTPPPLDDCFAAVSYAYPWSDCLAAYKFHDDPGWAATLATLLRSTPWVEPALERCDAVLPMPLSVQRLRQRGFNQALELARRLAPGKTDGTLLLRLRDTAPQSELDLPARQRNVKGAFAVDPLRAERVRQRRVVLVDDVMTSGASLFAAAAALRQAGAAHITGLVVARTEKE